MAGGICFDILIEADRDTPNFSTGKRQRAGQGARFGPARMLGTGAGFGFWLSVSICPPEPPAAQADAGAAPPSYFGNPQP